MCVSNILCPDIIVYIFSPASTGHAPVNWHFLLVRVAAELLLLLCYWSGPTENSRWLQRLKCWMICVTRGFASIVSVSLQSLFWIWKNTFIIMDSQHIIYIFGRCLLLLHGQSNTFFVFFIFLLFSPIIFSSFHMFLQPFFHGASA